MSKDKKNDTLDSLTKGMGNVVEGAVKTVNKIANVGSSVVNAIGKGINSTIDAGGEFIENQKINSLNKEIDSKILEHMYNIGSYMYENDIDLGDGIVISSTNTIDRLVEEIKELGGKKNG